MSPISVQCCQISIHTTLNCIFWDFFCSTIIFIKFFVVYLSMPDLLVRNYSWHKVLWLLPYSSSEIFSEWSESFVPFWQSESFPWPTRKGKYPVLRMYQSLTNLIKHTKISYLIASLVFCRFSCGNCWNGLH